MPRLQRFHLEHVAGQTAASAAQLRIDLGEPVERVLAVEMLVDKAA
ncbi:hypothetical protein [Variovorax sp. Sphag1AA]|nr:hypothetical protein [Variovorax sp. Sphag1AA]MBB3175890.1 hypothetical protein [Variovorax sp. Sphag1AA]